MYEKQVKSLRFPLTGPYKSQVLTSDLNIWEQAK